MSLPLIDRELRQLYEVLTELQREHHALFRDKYGTTEIKIGNNLTHDYISAMIENRDNFKLTLSPLVSKIFQRYSQNNLDLCSGYLVSIGGANEHIAARKLMMSLPQNCEMKLVTVPLPLSNDAFCTNRIGSNEKGLSTPSLASVYPDTIIIDLELLGEVGLNRSIVGIGEILGLYTSIMDYYLVRNLHVPSYLIGITLDIISRITKKNLEKLSEILFEISLGLIIKCLVMRLSNDHAIGASADHLISYSLEKQLIDLKMNYTHGELVFIGTIVTLMIFPEWENGIYNVKKLLEYGLKNHLIQLETLVVLFENFTRIITEAPLTRTNRPTLLRDIEVKRIEKVLKKNEVLRRFLIAEKQ